MAAPVEHQNRNGPFVGAGATDGDGAAARTSHSVARGRTLLVRELATYVVRKNALLTKGSFVASLGGLTRPDGDLRYERMKHSKLNVT